MVMIKKKVVSTEHVKVEVGARGIYKNVEAYVM
jgi:hypothetical protein